MSQEAAAVSEDDSLVIETMADVMPHRSSLMEGSMDTADWTSFDQQAAMSGNPDDNLSWSFVVIRLWACSIPCAVPQPLSVKHTEFLLLCIQSVQF